MQQVTLVLTLLTATTVLVAAVPHAAPAPAPSAPIQQQTAPQTRAQNLKQVPCKWYLGSDMQDSVAPCKPFCGNARDTAHGNVTSVTCMSGGMNIPKYHDNIGEYYPGVCRCNIGLIDELVSDVLIALPAIADIGCQLMVDAFSLVVQVGAAAIPGAGELEAADAGMQGLVKAGQAIKKAGKGANDMLGWLKPCGHSQFTDKIDAVFGDLTGGMVGGGGTGNLAADAAPPPSITKAAPKPAAPAKPPAPPAPPAKPTKASDALQMAFRTMVNQMASPKPKLKRASILSA